MSRTLIHEETVLISRLTMATSLPKRMRGLLGRSFIAADEGMLICPCRSIHMWFMRVPIDAAFLNDQMHVLRVARNLKPWQLAFAPRTTHSVLETAAGALNTVQVGDQLNLK